MNKELVKLCVDAVKGRVTNYSAQETSEVIRKSFVEMIGTDKPDYRTFREHAPKVFQIIEETLDQTIYDSILQTNFFNQFVEYRDLNLGDTNEFYVKDRTVLTVSQVADGHLNLRRQKLNIGAQFAVAVKTYGIKIYGDFLRMVSGRLDWADFVAQIQKAVQLKIAKDIFTGFMGASAYLPASFNVTGTFSDTAMSTLVQHVQAENGYAPVVIAGTRTALKKLNNAYNGIAGFFLNDAMTNQINQQGFLAQWEGIPLLEIPQVHDINTFNFMLDDTKLMVLPANEKPIKFVREGQSIIVDNTGMDMNMDMSAEYTYLTKYGMTTVFNTLYGVYTLQ